MVEELVAAIRELLSEYEAEIRRLRSAESGALRGRIEAKYVRCGRVSCKRCPHGPYYYLRY
ncbi:MAG: hypothetical protein ACXQTZ_05235 [Candidatus Alkanophagales archaeon]